MATVTGLTAARMLQIEGESIIDAEIVAGHLILTKHDGTTVDAGSVIGPAGPMGPEGPAGGLIPGEVRLWPGGVLPSLATYGRWVWADGAVYAVASYPIAAGHIATEWRTFGGASDPGGSNFRVPDMRGLVPAGMDAMPGGSRANRMTRSVAITIAAKTGEETHVITVPEMAAHAHGVNDPGHNHAANFKLHSGYSFGGQGGSGPYWWSDISAVDANGPVNVGAITGISIQNNGGGGGHENVQPTVFVPYIVKLDD